MNKLRWPIRSLKLITLLLAQVLLAGCQTTLSDDTRVVLNCPPYEDLYFVDAHSQVEIFINTQTGNEMTANQIRNFILKKMRAVDVTRSILSPRAGQSHRTILNISNHTFGTTKIYPAIAVKGRHYSRLQHRVDSGKFHALGEVLLYHEAKPGISAPKIVMYPSKPKVQKLYKVAKEEGWPLILHIEDAAMPSRTRIQMYEDLCRVGIQLGGVEAHSEFEIHCRNLYQNEFDMTDHPVVFIHMAQLPPDRVEWIINHNNNVYFMTSHSNPIAARRPQPWINMFSNGELSPSWGRLLKTHPERFIFALDNVTQDHWAEDYKEIVELWQKALERLPDRVAHAVAHGNAERLWGLPPLCDHAFPEDGDTETIQPDYFP